MAANATSVSVSHFSYASFICGFHDYSVRLSSTGWSDAFNTVFYSKNNSIWLCATPLSVKCTTWSIEVTSLNNESANSDRYVLSTLIFIYSYSVCFPSRVKQIDSSHEFIIAFYILRVAYYYFTAIIIYPNDSNSTLRVCDGVNYRDYSFVLPYLKGHLAGKHT